jgi:hypothetical protein
MTQSTQSTQHEPFEVAVGINEKEVWSLHSTFRTAKQFEAVRQIVQAEDFQFSCHSKVFDIEWVSNTKFRGTFVLLYYTKDKKLNVKRISPTGRITYHYATR